MRVQFTLDSKYVLLQSYCVLESYIFFLVTEQPYGMEGSLDKNVPTQQIPFRAGCGVGGDNSAESHVRARLYSRNRVVRGGECAYQRNQERAGPPETKQRPDDDAEQDEDAAQNLSTNSVQGTWSPPPPAPLLMTPPQTGAVPNQRKEIRAGAHRLAAHQKTRRRRRHPL